MRTELGQLLNFMMAIEYVHSIFVVENKSTSRRMFVQEAKRD
jgi:hypothetical protein